MIGSLSAAVEVFTQGRFGVSSVGREVEHLAVLIHSASLGTRFPPSQKLRCSNLAGLENGGLQRLTEPFLLPRDMWYTAYTVENCLPQNPVAP